MSRAARARDAPAASWRCQQTLRSAPGLDLWTTAPGFAFRPATARPPTASTTKSSRKVKLSVFFLLRPSDDSSPYLKSWRPARNLPLRGQGTPFTLVRLWRLAQSAASISTPLTDLYLVSGEHVVFANGTLFRLYSVHCYHILYHFLKIFLHTLKKTVLTSLLYI